MPTIQFDSFGCPQFVLNSSEQEEITKLLNRPITEEEVSEHISMVKKGKEQAKNYIL